MVLPGLKDVLTVSFRTSPMLTCFTSPVAECLSAWFLRQKIGRRREVRIATPAGKRTAKLAIRKIERENQVDPFHGTPVIPAYRDGRAFGLTAILPLGFPKQEQLLDVHY